MAVGLRGLTLRKIYITWGYVNDTVFVTCLKKSLKGGHMFDFTIEQLHADLFLNSGSRITADNLGKGL